MKHLVLAFALSTAVAACLAQDDTKTDTSDLDQAYACLTTADCPPNTVCGADSECHAPSTTTLPHSCSSTLQCPAHERCNPVCSTIGTVGHVCQPEGIATHVCPDPLP